MCRIVDSGSCSTECCNLGLRSAARKKANQVWNPASRKERVIPSPERFSKAVSNPDGALLVSWTSVRYCLRISTTSAKRFAGLSPFGTVGLIGTTESSAIVRRRLTRKVRARRNAGSGLVKRGPREARALGGPAFAAVAGTVAVPVYAIGGIDVFRDSRRHTIRQRRACRIARPRRPGIEQGAGQGRRTGAAGRGPRW